ncbi:hypothetical protein HZH66_014186 [Vespula vulgaris]|uniref:Uncharacterized protein n=1 Tax=Vespula vulgaris TaxID=7454 RepID=A0A834MQA8_VESVU|nr:hypothetical protein HZH66_014186 [Vespula vulgaris]
MEILGNREFLFDLPEANLLVENLAGNQQFEPIFDDSHDGESNGRGKGGGSRHGSRLNSLFSSGISCEALSPIEGFLRMFPNTEIPQSGITQTSIRYKFGRSKSQLTTLNWHDPSQVWYVIWISALWRRNNGFAAFTGDENIPYLRKANALVSVRHPLVNNRHLSSSLTAGRVYRCPIENRQRMNLSKSRSEKNSDHKEEKLMGIGEK